MAKRSAYAADSYGESGARPGGRMNATQYYGGRGFDMEKSARLMALREEYGGAMDNEIAGTWQEINGQGGMGVVAPSFDGTTNYAKAQDIFLNKYGVRAAHQATRGGR